MWNDVSKNENIQQWQTANGGVLWKKGVLRNFCQIYRKTPVPESCF